MAPSSSTPLTAIDDASEGRERATRPPPRRRRYGEVSAEPSAKSETERAGAAASGERVWGSSRDTAPIRERSEPRDRSEPAQRRARACGGVRGAQPPFASEAS